jgi:hypothetical protein
LRNVSEIEGHVAFLQEEDRQKASTIANLEDRLVACERKNRRLELEALKRPKDSDTQDRPMASPTGTENSTNLSTEILAERDGLKDLAAKRMFEMKQIQLELSELRIEKGRLEEQVH